MKKTILIAILALASCKKSSTNPQPASLLIGKWTHVKDIVINVPADNSGNIIDTAVFTGSSNYYQFNTGGTGLISQQTVLGATTYNTFPFTYTITGNAVTITVNGQSESETIKTLTSSSLVLYTQDTETDNTGKTTSTDQNTQYFSK